MWLRCVVDGCGWFWSVCSFGMSVVWVVCGWRDVGG